MPATAEAAISRMGWTFFQWAMRMAAVSYRHLDVYKRQLFAPYEIPVGILLSFLGGPFFLFLIVKQRRRPSRPGRKGASG